MHPLVEFMSNATWLLWKLLQNLPGELLSLQPVQQRHLLPNQCLPVLTMQPDSPWHVPPLHAALLAAPAVLFLLLLLQRAAVPLQLHAPASAHPLQPNVVL